MEGDLEVRMKRVLMDLKKKLSWHVDSDRFIREK